RTPSFLCDTSTTSLYTLSLHDALPIFFVVAQDPPPESEHPTAHGMDREHYPALETIECFGLAPGLFLDNGQARLLQEFQLIALIQGLLGKGSPLIQAIPQAELADGGIAETTFLEIAQPNGLSGGALPKGLGKISLGKLTDQVHALPLVGQLPILKILLGLLHLYIVFPCQVFYGLGVGEMLVFHQEGDHVPPFSTAEVLPDLFDRGNHKTGRTFIRKGTESLKVGTGFLQLHKIPDHLLQTGGFIYFVNGGF